MPTNMQIYSDSSLDNAWGELYMPDNVSYMKDIPVIGIADVVVAGGGLGGIAAALASARAGASTIIVERNGFLGGVATAGMCCSLFNCLLTPERKLKVKGFPLEIVNLLAEKGGGPGLSWQHHKGHVIYDVERAKVVLAEILEEAGVQIRIDSPVADVITEGAMVTGVVTAGKNGLGVIKCKQLVDATGDCDAAVLAGAEYSWQETAKASYVFRVGNVNTDRFVQYFREHPDQYPEHMDIDWTLAEALAQYDENGTFLFPHGGGMQMSLVAKAIKNGDLPEYIGEYDTLDAMQLHLIRDLNVCHVITGYVKNSDLDAATLSHLVLDGKRVAFAFTNFMKKYLPGFEHSFVSATADDLGIRGSRQIVGRSVFTKEMRTIPYRCKDAIGVGVVQKIKKLNQSERAWNAQIMTEDVFEIPLSCLLSSNIENLVIGSGRGVCSLPPLQLRAMGYTMIVGQGAGVAAAVAAKEGVPVSRADYADIRRELIRQDVEFPEL